jgi:hypothetical protein
MGMYWEVNQYCSSIYTGNANSFTQISQCIINSELPQTQYPIALDYNYDFNNGTYMIPYNPQIPSSDYMFNVTNNMNKSLNAYVQCNPALGNVFIYAGVATTTSGALAITSQL